MFGISYFVELGDMDMRILVGGPMSDWKNEGLCFIDGATMFDHPDGTTYILRATGIVSPCPTTLRSKNQLRASGSEVNDIATVHGGKSNIITPCSINLPLEYRRGLVTLPIRKPTATEVKECDHVNFSTTSWDPSACYSYHSFRSRGSINLLLDRTYTLLTRIFSILVTMSNE